MNISLEGPVAKIAATYLPLIGTQTLIKQTMSTAANAIGMLQVTTIAINSIVYLIIGLIVFEICLRNSKKLGILNRY